MISKPNWPQNINPYIGPAERVLLGAYIQKGVVALTIPFGSNGCRHHHLSDDVLTGFACARWLLTKIGVVFRDPADGVRMFHL